MDASDLIRVEGSACVEFEPSELGGYKWRVDILHDHDGYHVGILFNEGEEGVRLNIDAAERFALSVLRAATAATVWNDVRERLN